MADEASSDEPEHRAHVSDAAEGAITAETPIRPAPHLDASADVPGRAPSSSPDQGACLVHSTSKASVHRVSDCAPFRAAADFCSFPSNGRKSSTSPQQGNPELSLSLPGLGACIKSDISESCVLDQATPGSRGVCLDSDSLKAETPLSLVPVHSDLRTGAPIQGTTNMNEGTQPPTNCDEANKPVKTGGKAGILSEKTNTSFGGRGEMVGLDVFTVFRKSEVVLRRSLKLPEDDGTVSEDSDERGCRSKNRSPESGTRKMPDMPLIHNVVDDLIEEFGSQSHFTCSSVSLPLRHTPPITPRLKRGETPKRTRSSPLDTGEKRDRLFRPHTERKTIAARKWASITCRRSSSEVEAGGQESSSGVTIEKEAEMERVLTACSVLKSVIAYVSNEARQHLPSQSNITSKCNRGKQKTEKRRCISRQKSKGSDDAKVAKRRRKFLDVSIEKPRSPSKKMRGGNKSRDKLRRDEADRNVSTKSSSRNSKLVDLTFDIEVSLPDEMDESEPKQKTKKRFKRNRTRIEKREGRRILGGSSESEESFVEQDEDGKTVPFIKEPSRNYENELEDYTEIQAAILPQRQKRRLSKPGKIARNDEPLSVAGGSRRHASHWEVVVGGNRERHTPRSEKSRYYNDVSVENSETQGVTESESCVDNQPHSPKNITVASKVPPRSNTRGTTPYPRNSSGSFSMDLEWRQSESSDPDPGPVDVAFENRCVTRFGYPAVQRRSNKHGSSRRELQRPVRTRHTTTPLPRAGTQPAPLKYKQRFETQVYASLSRPPHPVQSPSPPYPIGRPVFEATALFNEPALAHCNSWRPSGPHGALSELFQDDLSASKPKDVIAAEPDFPQPVPPQPEQKHTNEQSMLPRSFQAAFDAAEPQRCLPSVGVNLPEAAVDTPSALQAVPGASAYSEEVEGTDGVPRSTTRLVLPGAEHFQSTLPHQNDFCEGCSSNLSAGTQQPCIQNEDEMEKHATDAGSTEFIIMSNENRLHRAGLKTIFGGRVSITLVILVAGLSAVIAAGFALNARRLEPLDITDNGEDSAEHPWVFSPLSHTDSETTASRHFCKTELCRELAGKLFRAVDADVRLCRNFYRHVCALAALNDTEDEQLVQTTTPLVLSFLKASNNDASEELPVVLAARRLWHDCVHMATLIQKDKAPLLALLNLTGLGAWPYDDNVSHPEVWKVAGDLQRLMALAPLVELKGLSGGKARLAPGNLGGPDDAADVLDAMLALHPNGSRLLELAEDVAGLTSRLKKLRHRNQTLKSVERSDIEILPRSYLEAMLTSLDFDVGAVDFQLEPLVLPLVETVQHSRPQTVLNLLGYRLVRHVDVFTPAAAITDLESGDVLSRESRCTRAILDDALSNEQAEYVRYAAVRDHLNFSAVRSVVADVRGALDAKLAEQPWLDLRTRKSLQRNLSEVKVHFFFDNYASSSEIKPVSPTLAQPSEALATYQRFRESLFRTRLLQDTAYDDEGDPYCTYNQHKKVVFLRLSAVELRDSQSPLWPALQAAWLGPRLSRCMLRVLLPSTTDRNSRAAVHWSLAARTRLDDLRACMRAQHGRRSKAAKSDWGPAQEATAVVENAALGPARDVFHAYVEHLVRQELLGPVGN
ncbi:hypothetical protein HPB48_018173 [Haemaphysalis longicornis]|uniref:Uncharacterized protein n=1 Tax=Haemaphysalis longicornis TaxID=44386 RepID=A0A9J6GM49_HAELO|nr:hypothetical protein HPB48_018173 [Haemaphysalis longicornis]